MPVYLVTDKQTNTRMMVEAERPAAAINTLVNARFDVSVALDAVAAIGLTGDGVKFLKADADFAASEPVAEEAEHDQDTGGEVTPAPDHTATAPANPSDWPEDCTCLEEFGEDPDCKMHGRGTDWWDTKVAQSAEALS